MANPYHFSGNSPLLNVDDNGMEYNHNAFLADRINKQEERYGRTRGEGEEESFFNYSEARANANSNANQDQQPPTYAEAMALGYDHTKALYISKGYTQNNGEWFDPSGSKIKDMSSLEYLAKTVSGAWILITAPLKTLTLFTKFR